MKNIHVLPTNKARLYIHQGKLYDHKKTMHIADGTQIPQNIHITSDKEVKDCWVLNTHSNQVYFVNGYYGIQPNIKKIILTTDQELIKDGVQAIDDEFLEWFVKNPSCEEVEVSYEVLNPFQSIDKGYVLRLPDIANVLEEPKQETIEEAIKREYEARKFDSVFPFDPQSFALGAEWQAEQDNNKFSEEEVLQLIINCKERFGGSDLDDYVEDSTVIKWFEQFKKK